MSRCEFLKTKIELSEKNLPLKLEAGAWLWAEGSYVTRA